MLQKVLVPFSAFFWTTAILVVVINALPKILG